MFQVAKNIRPLEKEWNEFTDEVLPDYGTASITDEWDMEATYVPNWACIFNNPNDIGRKCRIIIKNDRLALIKWVDNPTLNDDDGYYRVEDLTKVES